MVNIDGSFLIGIAAILTSLATLWRTARGESWQGRHALLDDALDGVKLPPTASGQKCPAANDPPNPKITNQ
ncbi:MULTISPECIES: hypothetical protein [Sphingobium]|uniref:hypothetical protein n=1 Tax=Sphingobium TaxID=165695 RepID=UPI00159CBB87|nr:hypothetical protein [Sphingobium sp. 15-1]